MLPSNIFPIDQRSEFRDCFTSYHKNIRPSLSAFHSKISRQFVFFQAREEPIQFPCLVLPSPVSTIWSELIRPFNGYSLQNFIIASSATRSTLFIRLDFRRPCRSLILFSPSTGQYNSGSP